MITSALAPLLTSLRGLPFVDKVAGPVFPVTAEVDGRTITYPVACSDTPDDCLGEGRYPVLLPNDAHRVVLYIEQTGSGEIEVVRAGSEMLYQFNLPARLVGWVNLRALGHDECAYTDEVFLNVLKVLNTTGARPRRYNLPWGSVEVEVTGMAQRSPSLFGAYSVDVQELYPFDYFAIDLVFHALVNMHCVGELNLGEALC